MKFYEISNFEKYNGFCLRGRSTKKALDALMLIDDGRCQGYMCRGNQPRLNVEHIHIDHIVQWTHRAAFERLFPSLDIGNLLNLRISCSACNKSRTTDFAYSPMLLQDIFNSRARRITSRYEKKLKNGSAVRLSELSKGKSALLTSTRGPGTPISKWSRLHLKNLSIDMYMRGCSPDDIVEVNNISKMTLYRWLYEERIPRRLLRRSSPVWERPIDVIRILYCRGFTEMSNRDISAFLLKSYGTSLSTRQIEKMVNFVQRNLGDLIPVCNAYRHLAPKYSSVYEFPRRRPSIIQMDGAKHSRSMLSETPLSKNNTSAIHLLKPLED